MIPKELAAASAKPIILSILAKGESYGYAIIQEVRQLSGEQMQWTDGMLYPVLHRLERQGLLWSRWAESETGRKRKYYRLTGPGTKELQTAHKQWMLVHSTLEKLWEDVPCLT